jgi:hypothetical protein
MDSGPQVMGPATLALSMQSQSEAAGREASLRSKYGFFKAKQTIIFWRNNYETRLLRAYNHRKYYRHF